MKINILSKGFLSYIKGMATSIVKNKQLLSEMGIEVNFYFKFSDEVKYCDVVIVESRFVYLDWRANKSKIFDLNKTKTQNNKVFYYDLGDSTYSWGLEAPMLINC